MANRIVGNVVIVDSAMGNALITASGGTVQNLNDYKVATIAFWSSDTTGVCRFTLADTTNCVLQLTNPNNNPTTVGATIPGVFFKDMKVPSITAGTAWIYLI